MWSVPANTERELQRMTSEVSALGVRRVQYYIAAVFVALGAWCMVVPGTVISLTVRPQYQTDHPLALLAIGAFGAQAILAGLFAAFSSFTRRTFQVFGIALLPFFGFDAWFYWRQPIFNEFILLDFIGNALMLALCIRGYRTASATCAELP
jgi:hypothetical protein